MEPAPQSFFRTAIFRLIVDALLLVGIFVWPWWLSLVVIALLFLYFQSFYEGIVAAVLIDALYAGGTGIIGGLKWFVTLGTLVVFAVLSYIKQFIRVYPSR